MSYTVHFDDTQVKEMLAKAPDETKATVRRILEKSGIETMAEMRIQAPVGVTGDLRRTTHYIFEGSASVVIEPTAQYAKYVETGTRPHWTSVKEGTPLYKWAMQKGISPYAVQRSIAQKGTKAHPFIRPTYDNMLVRVQDFFDTGIAELASKLNG